MWHTSNIPLCKLDHVDSAIFTEFSSVWAKWLPFSKLVMYHSLFLMFFHYHHDYGRAKSLDIGVFEGWKRGALPLLNLFLSTPLKIFNDAVQQADN